MIFTDVVFYVLAAILLFSGIRVITTRNPVHAALFLVLAFFTAAGIWLLLEAEFLAIALILVYVGAVMVLFLFVVMMLDINLDKLREGFWEYLPMAGFIGILMVVEMTLVLADKNLQPSQAVELPANYSNTAAIVLTLRERKDNKSMNPSEQVKVKRNDRLRIVSMPAEVEPPEPAPASAPAKEERK